MRLPVPIVQQHLKAILDGILLWSGDSKNQFKLKVQPISDFVLHTAGFPLTSVVPCTTGFAQSTSDMFLAAAALFVHAHNPQLAGVRPKMPRFKYPRS